MKSSIQQACIATLGGFLALPALVLAMPSVDRWSATTPGLAAEIAAPGNSSYVPPAGVFVPESSRGKPADAGHFAHTNYFVKNVKGIQPQRMTDLAVAAPARPGGQPSASFAEYPASLACLYKMGKNYAGCKPVNNPKHNATGGERAIALVLAFDNPSAGDDLAYFSAMFGLPPASFTKVYANGNGHCSVPPYDPDWALESAMDTQWAHAMAPSAQIILVEACSNSMADLMYAEQVAGQQLLNYGGGQVSNSWSSAEWSTESSDWDWVFRTSFYQGKPISFFFASGDGGLGPQYPSVSPWVVSVGGTTVNRDATTQAFQSESCWAGSGGGVSQYETWSATFGTGTGPWAAFQYPHFGPNARATPDVAADADPASGGWVTLGGGFWYVVGGTSLATPIMAAIVNNAGNREGVAPSQGGYYANMENNLIYSQLDMYKNYAGNWYDVTTGSNGASAGVGWDFCTGVGAPRGKNGK